MDEMKHPDLKAATLYLFMIEIHTGNAIHPQFKWISDIFTIMGYHHGHHRDRFFGGEESGKCLIC